MTRSFVRVVVVDDQPVFRRVARQLLEHRGYAVVGEADGAVAAEDAVARLSPDAVLLDVRLGAASGFDVSYALTRAHPTLAVLLVCADPAYADWHALTAATGARGIVPKGNLAHTDLADFWQPPLAPIDH
jgi:DNA-binding NarL/FixJ family response regulator